MFKGHGAEKVLYVNYISAVMVQLYTYAHSGTIIAENVSFNSLNCYLVDRLLFFEFSFNTYRAVKLPSLPIPCNGITAIKRSDKSY